MKKLMLFCSFLSILLGMLQLFFPQFLNKIEEFSERIFSVGEWTPLAFRKISGIIFIVVGATLLYSTLHYSF